ncbi:hypothetical protein LNP04_17005 [Chryseobacterium sp. C-71]|uniref:hypothetical protein n=1 Tax=Chryseobacterium sp. C-71 TaxID=2893882 RepID=UPI001E42D981|nr:hypothetical protein [Chryseobacterium sp. C-71]UFH31647.1 hypothetical protein LNP04_17005 [Chryseobacterium sp. C-71]
MEIFRKIVIMVIMFLIAHSVFKAQESMRYFEELVETEEEIRLLSMSDYGKWIAWQSVYESRPAEMKVASVNNSKQLFTEAGARQWQFVRENEMVYLLGKNAKYRNLSSQKVSTFFDVRSAGYLKHLDQVYIHHNDKSFNRLDFYDRDMNIVQSFFHVRRMVEVKNDVMILRKNGAEDELIKYNGKEGITIFKSPSQIYSVSASGLQSAGWLLRVQGEKGLKMFYVSSDLSSTQLSFDSKNQFDGIQQDPSSVGDAVLLTLETKKVKNKGMVDIWYRRSRKTGQP